jgi:hypothetical protein
MEEGSSYFYIFDKKEDPGCSRDNFVQTRTQVNKFNIREQREKEKVKDNTLEQVKQQEVVNQGKTPL